MIIAYEFLEGFVTIFCVTCRQGWFRGLHMSDVLSDLHLQADSLQLCLIKEHNLLEYCFKLWLVVDA